MTCEYHEPYDKGDSVGVLLSKRDGTFRNAVRYQAEYGTGATTVADVNGDGRLDVVASRARVGGSIKVFIGNGDGTLQPLRLFGRVAVGLGGLGAIISADVDGDRHPDVAALYGGPSGMRVFRNARRW